MFHELILKWLIKAYRNDEFDPMTSTDERKNTIYQTLLVFDSKWYRNKYKGKTTYTIGGVTTELNDHDHDINKYSLGRLIEKMSGKVAEYKALSEDGKYDIIYQDKNILILSPNDFAACFNYSKDTQWCSQSFSGYEMWSKGNLMLRFIPTYDPKQKCRLTWAYNDQYRWSWASPKYPEFLPYDFAEVNNKDKDFNPFDFNKFDYSKFEGEDKRLVPMKTANFIPLKKVFDLLTPQAIASCKEYYEMKRNSFKPTVGIG